MKRLPALVLVFVALCSGQPDSASVTPGLSVGVQLNGVASDADNLDVLRDKLAAAVAWPGSQVTTVSSTIFVQAHVSFVPAHPTPHFP